LSDAATVLERCARLGEVSEQPGLLVRRYGTEAMREANALVGGWMRAAGLDVREDAVGNLIGRRGAGPALMLGSHLDTVRDAGRYDGPLGVLTALAAAERVPETAVEVVGFADEEGLRFGTAYLGSAAMAGRFDPAWLARRDADGLALADVLPGDPASAARDPSELRGYAEVHIEQGPVLERLGEPLGVVTAIIGQSHAEVRFTGEAGHAGTVPMNARRDALAGAAEWMLSVESVARRRQGTVATVGRIAVEPDARNVIPGEALMTLDVRHTSNAVRREAIADMRAEAERIAAAREIELDWDARGETAAVPTSPDLTDLLADAVEATGHTPERLPSGAGHDAVQMAALTDVAMLFVRCEKGISHNPAEAVAEADVAVALDVLERFLGVLA
jgi:allantoate deiminase